MTQQKKVRGSESDHGASPAPLWGRKQSGSFPAPLQETPPNADRPRSECVGEERLTPQELKRRFACNLDALLRIIGLTRKDAAQAIGVAYKLLRRLASSGVSFVEDRNTEALTMITNYLALPGVDYLWLADLLPRLLTTDEGRGFVEKFRPLLLAERERRLAGARVVADEEMKLVGRALGVEDADQPLLARGQLRMGGRNPCLLQRSDLPVSHRRLLRSGDPITTGCREEG